MSQSDLPCLKTQRLLLRPFVLQDALAVTRYAGSHEVAANTNIPHPYPDGAAEAWIKTHPTNWVERKSLTLSITVLGSDEPVGAISLLDISAVHRRAELGYWVSRECWSKGYATEAVRAIVGYAFDTLGLHRLIGRCLARNKGSARVLEKTGFLHEGRLRQHVLKDGEFHDLIIFGRLAPTTWPGSEEPGQ